MKQVNLQGNVYDIGIEANEFSDKALEQIVGVIRPILNEKDKEIERLTNELEREKSQVKEYGTKLIKIREYINSIGWNTTIPNIQDNVWKILDKE